MCGEITVDSSRCSDLRYYSARPLDVKPTRWVGYRLSKFQYCRSVFRVPRYHCHSVSNRTLTNPTTRVSITMGRETRQSCDSFTQQCRVSHSVPMPRDYIPSTLLHDQRILRSDHRSEHRPTTTIWIPAEANSVLWHGAGMTISSLR